MQAQQVHSLADRFNLLPQAERLDFLGKLSDQEALELLYDWDFWARPNQRLPEGDWIYWLVMAGRGWGKTRVGAETVRNWARSFKLVNLIGPTADDARDVMIEGPAGVLNICPPHERPEYLRSMRKLRWPNGAESLIFTADEPERLRGKQHEKLWCDEIAAWRYEESWDQAQFGLRLGSAPQAVATTTPKPVKIVRDLVKDSRTYLTRGTTFDNKENLAAAFLSRIVSVYQGTRLGRQELNAELLEDNPGALWSREQLEQDRVDKHPDLERIVVALDPAVTSTGESDEWGIVVAGRSRGLKPAHYYALADLSGIYTPDKAAAVAVNAYHTWSADRVVGEANNGGDMIEALLRHKDPNVSYKKVHASRGKITRAEPTASVYEQHRAHHLGVLATLEDQMCDYNPATSTRSPDRMDALVWAMTELSEGVHGLFDLYREQAEVANKTAAPESTLAQLQKKDTPLTATINKARKQLAIKAASGCACGNTSPQRYPDGRWKCNDCGAAGKD